MAKLQVFTLDNLTLYDELIKNYIDTADATVDAKSLKSVALDGNVLKIYNVSEPVGETAPLYEIELPQTDLTNVLTRLVALEEGKADASTVYTKTEIDKTIEEVQSDINANAEAIETINDEESGILAQAKAYADTEVQELADGQVKTNTDAIASLTETVQNIEEYDDTELRGLVQSNTDAIATLNGNGEGSVAKAVADAKALVDADVDAVEARLDTIENADTGILAQSKTYTDETVASAVSEVKASLASALTYKGQKATESELPTEGNVCGDVWNVTTTDEGTSAEFVWIIDDEEAGTGHWEELGTALDLSAYAEKEQVVTDIATAKTEAVNEAKTYADGLASNYDAAGSAAVALTEAKSYIDTEVAKATAAVTALEEGQVATNTEAIASNAEAIAGLQSTLGEGVEPISESEINALFA